MTVNFNDAHKLHQEWKQNLLQSEHETKSMNQELTVLVNDAKTEEQRKTVDHLQNQLIRQKEVINDQLAWVVKADKIMSEKTADDNEISILHKKMVDDMDTFNRLFNELRVEFRNFKSSLLNS
ncbi:hypothetical protein LX64_02457 [Chitinophaga skermanii]|uniref:Uncharacterized protein n=1 Tax=Chitinophaga skermanii TaxID=331697 RepID=A0A327QLU6_9BACT|nr:hypothetical protein [Chitinophaga skermanii]RAJ05300.1 hypothetical protein LX64_02457 [Chitinophaga skermanii]